MKAALESRGLANRVVELERSARTAPEAAEAVGCSVAQIVKSLVFRRRDGAVVLVVASGVGRVDEAKLGEILGGPVQKADASLVRTATGFAIGGVAPIGHPAPIETLVDADLLQHAEIWAAAGHPSTVFRLTPAELIEMTAGRVVVVR